MTPQPLFLGMPAGPAALTRAVTAVAGAVTRAEAAAVGPCPAADPDDLARTLAGLEPCPAVGLPFDEVLEQVSDLVLAQGVRPHHPWCAAHLHSPTLLTAAAAEVAIGATNQSLDSFDQAPAATLVEDRLVRWLAGELGLPPSASGVFTAGGTASNLLGLYLAREHHLPAARHGLPPEARNGRILCSAAAHFSVQQAAAVLGLGHDAVVPVATDAADRLDPGAFDRTVATLPAGTRIVAVVGTAGTTDAGAIDPLDALADRAEKLGAWFHVDAAVGGAFCLSPRLAPRLQGIERAGSVTLDLHKLLWQPLGASVLLTRSEGSLAPARLPSDYLDRPEDTAGDDGQPGIINLVGRSLDTSRRFDALKVLISLRSTGRQRLASMLDHVVDTTRDAADHVDGHPDLELLRPPSTVMLLFRWNPRGGHLSGEVLDRINTDVQKQLFRTGRAVIGRTRLTPPDRSQPEVALKLTVVNPATTLPDLLGLLDLVTSVGRRLADPRETTIRPATIPVP